MNDDDLRADLDAWMEDPEPHETVFDDWEDREPERLPDEEAVNRMLRKRARLVREMERVEAIAAQEDRQRREWVADRCGGIRRQLEWLDRGLEGYMRQFKAATRRKSLPLPAGTLKLTAPGVASLEVSALADFLVWVDAERVTRGQLVKKVETPIAALVKDVCSLGPQLDEQDGRAVFAVVDESGEVVPGLVFTKPSVERFAVTQPAQDEASTNPKER